MVIPAMVTGMQQVTVEQRTDDALALNNQAWSMVKDPGHDREQYTEGLQLAQIADALVPNNHYYLNTLGVAQYRLGHYEQALTTLARSDELNKQAPNAYNRASDLLFLAMAHWKLGHAAEARALLATSKQALEGVGSEELAGFLDEAETLMKPQTF